MGGSPWLWNFVRFHSWNVCQTRKRRCGCLLSLLHAISWGPSTIDSGSTERFSTNQTLQGCFLMKSSKLRKIIETIIGKWFINYWNVLSNFRPDTRKVFLFEVSNSFSRFCWSALEWSSLAKKWEFSPSPSIHRQSIMDNNILDLASLYSEDEEPIPSWIGMKSTIALNYILGWA